MDEYAVPKSSQPALAHAKEDFLLAQRGLAPIHARLVKVNACERSRVYDGTGYRLVLVDRDWPNQHAKGPDLILYSSLTGGKPYHYDLVENLWDE